VTDVRDPHERWMKEANSRRELNALEGEFTLAKALIRAGRCSADAGAPADKSCTTKASPQCESHRDRPRVNREQSGHRCQPGIRRMRTVALWH